MNFRRGLGLSALLSGVAALTIVAAACSSSSTTSDTPSSAESGVDGSASQVDGGGAGDGSVPTADAQAPGTCEGACKVTSLEIDIGGKLRTLSRAQFGTQAGAGGPELHTESHLGGQAACPDVNSPSPDYTLIVTAVPRGAAGNAISDREGVASTLFDFKGDLGLPPFTKAVSVNLTVTAEDTATPPAWVAIDVVARFREGEVKGHLYAEYCASLSE
jgi:hypothetical protein